MNRVELLELIAKWYTLGVHDTGGNLYLPVPGYDNRTIEAYATGYEAACIYQRLLEGES